MKFFILLMLLSASCFAISPRAGEAEPLEGKEAFEELLVRISDLGTMAERKIREKYQLSDEEELVLYAYHIAYGDNVRPPKEDSRPYFLFYFGAKSSLGYIKQDKVGDFDWPDVLTYGISYRVAVNLQEETIRIIDIIEDEKNLNPGVIDSTQPD